MHLFRAVVLEVTNTNTKYKIGTVNDVHEIKRIKKRKIQRTRSVATSKWKNESKTKMYTRNNFMCS